MPERRKIDRNLEDTEQAAQLAYDAGDMDENDLEQAFENTEAGYQGEIIDDDGEGGIDVLPGPPLEPGGPGRLEDLGAPSDLSHVGGMPPAARNVDGEAPPVSGPYTVRLSRPEEGVTGDVDLWTLIRNRTDAVSFNNYHRYMDAILCGDTRAVNSLPSSIRSQVNDLAFLGLDGYDVLRTATEWFLMQEVGLVVEDTEAGFDPAYLQERYDRSMGHLSTRITDVSYDAATGVLDYDSEDVFAQPNLTDEYRRRNLRPLSPDWLTNLRNGYLEELAGTSSPKVLPYLGRIMSRLRDLPIKGDREVPGACYGVLPSKLVGPLGLELIWSYWHEEGMIVQAHNAITNRFQNLRSGDGTHDPLSRLEIDPLRRVSNVLWGWIQSRPFLLSVRRRAYEYDHQYGVTLLGTAVGEVRGADSRSQFLSAFHNLLHACTIFYHQDDDLTVHADGFPLLNALRECQLVLTAGAHNQYGDLPWTARVEMLMQLWMLSRPEMRDFLGGRVMVPYKEPWMDRVDAVKSMMGWTDVNVTHFRDLGTFGEQVVLSIRYGGWSSEIQPAAAINWARYWRPEIQGYVHAYRAATGIDLRQNIDTTMPGILLQRQLEQQALSGRRGVLAAPAARAALPAAARSAHELT